MSRRWVHRISEVLSYFWWKMKSQDRTLQIWNELRPPWTSYSDRMQNYEYRQAIDIGLHMYRFVRSLQETEGGGTGWFRLGNIPPWTPPTLGVATGNGVIQWKKPERSSIYTLMVNRKIVTRAEICQNINSWVQRCLSRSIYPPHPPTAYISFIAILRKIIHSPADWEEGKSPHFQHGTRYNCFRG